MARTASRPVAEQERTLRTLRRKCVACGGAMWCDYDNRRTVVTLGGPVALRLKVRRCVGRACPRYHRPYRPESEGGWALPQQEFGLDVIAGVGALRYQEHRSVPEIAGRLIENGSASSATFDSPCASRARIPRRVGSASAAKVRLS